MHPTPPNSSGRRSLLAWPAWLRVIAVTPLLLLLWLGVAWASMDVPPW